MTPARFITRVLSGAVVVAVLWFYYWTVGSPRIFAGPQPDYYNLLVDGFQDGSLAMKVTPDPWLGVDNTKAKHYLLDASFYRGKYYLYFGVTPALVLIWPWTALTGHDLSEPAAAALLAGLAFLLSLGWLATLRRHFFPAVGGGYWIVAVAVLGVATGYPVVLRRPLFYEIAIFSGVACSFGGLWCLTLALLRPRQALVWLSAGSLCAGLAAGSRPTLIPGAILAVAVATCWTGWRERLSITPRRAVWLGLAAMLPAGLCGAGLAWYNWARFDSPWEFGLLHQLGSNGNGFPFTLGHLAGNLRVYYLTPPDFSWFFPFFAPGVKPPGSYQEQVHGQFLFLPWLGLAAVWVIARGWRRETVKVEVRVAACMAGIWAGVAFVFVAMAWPHANRYMLDFHPVGVALALLGLFACAAGSPGWRRAARAAAALSLVPLVFNLCTGFHVHGFFRSARPEEFARIARLADRLIWPLHRLTGPRLGGMEAVVRFPEGTPGNMEPLLVAGGGPDMDAIIVKYTAPGRGRLVFMHLGQGEVESGDFDLQPGRARWLKIHLGSLYPPRWHPWYDTFPAGMVRAGNRVSVTVDGKRILERDVACFQASANQVRLGERGGFPIGRERFSGMIERVRGLHADTAWLQELQQAKGALQLKLLLPRDRFGQQEPLLLTGRPGQADLVSVHYVREGVVGFSVLHEGWASPVISSELEWDYTRPLEVFIGLDSSPGSPGVQVEADGRLLLAKEFMPHPADATEVYIGCLPWPMAGSRILFGGALLEQSWVSPGSEPLRRARHTLLSGRPVELEFELPDGGAFPNQPVLTTGITGRGDGIFVERLPDGQISLGFDHWGSQPLRSAPLAFAARTKHRVTVSFGARISSTATVRGQLQVAFDGRPVFDEPVDLFPADPDLVFWGANPIGMSTSRPVLAGSWRIVERGGQASPP